MSTTVTGATYINLLDSFFTCEDLPPNFLFQDDNAPAHRSSLVTSYHERTGTRRIDWPAKSPDLNPIEHVWDFIGRMLHSKKPFDRMQDLECAVITEWNRIPQTFIDKLIDSMPRRITTVLEARGGPTPY